MIHLSLTAVLLVGLLVLGAYDIKTLRLPNVLTLGLIMIGLIIGFADRGFSGLGEAACGAALGFASLWGIATMYRKMTHSHGLGLGDAKLFAAAGAWLGPFYLPPLMACASRGALWILKHYQFAIRPLSKDTPNAGGQVSR